MSDQDSLLPEPPLWFYPSIAVALGLGEAVLLQKLAQLANAQSGPGAPQTLRITLAQLQAWLPFWDAAEIDRLLHQLAECGLIALQPGPVDTLCLGINTGKAAKSAPARTVPSPAQAPRSPSPVHSAPSSRPTWPRATAGNGAAMLPEHWQPSAELLALLGQMHGIRESFALAQVEDFVLYWRERGEASHAWENKFRQHVLSRWRRAQQDAGERFSAASQPTVLDRNWYPSQDALEILERSGVNRTFIDDAVPEFILYWRERGESPKTLNSRFIQHIRRQWARYTSAVASDNEPSSMQSQWRPSEDVMEILALSHIERSFAESVLPEFILYWRDRGVAQTSWNTKFLQHVKYHWAKRHQLTGGTADAGQPDAGRTGSTRTRSLAEDLDDRSWAS